MSLRKRRQNFGEQTFKYFNLILFNLINNDHFNS